VALDGSSDIRARLNQTINGLTAGRTYTVGFYWAAAQQAGFFGPTTEQFVVSLGNQAQSTAVWSNPEAGFSGWFREDFSFTAQSGSEVLSFLAVGTPTGQPPFLLLDGVSLQAAVPEPATWAMLIVGFGLVGTMARRRKAAVAA
jgi:PEP-CTERM motif